MLTIVSCPQCGHPAEIIDRFVLESTDGPAEHVRVLCLARHHFMLPTEALTRSAVPMSAAA
jgi:hypothetical protein